MKKTSPLVIKVITVFVTPLDIAKEFIKQISCWIKDRDRAALLLRLGGSLLTLILFFILVKVLLIVNKEINSVAPEPAPIVKAEPEPIPIAQVVYFKAGNTYRIDTVEIGNVRLSSMVLGARTPEQIPRALYVMIHACLLGPIHWYDTLSKDMTQGRVLLIDDNDTPYIGHRLAMSNSYCSRLIGNHEAVGVQINHEYLTAHSSGFSMMLEAHGLRLDVPERLAKSLLNGLDTAISISMQNAAESAEQI